MAMQQMGLQSVMSTSVIMHRRDKRILCAGFIGVVAIAFGMYKGASPEGVYVNELIGSEELAVYEFENGECKLSLRAASGNGSNKTDVFGAYGRSNGQWIVISDGRSVGVLHPNPIGIKIDDGGIAGGISICGYGVGVLRTSVEPEVPNNGSD